MQDLPIKEVHLLITAGTTIGHDIVLRIGGRHHLDCGVLGLDDGTAMGAFEIHSVLSLSTSMSAMRTYNREQIRISIGPNLEGTG